MTNRIVQFTGLMLVALVIGVFWGTWFTLTRSLETFTPAEFLHIGQTIIANVAVPMRMLMPASLLVMLWSIWLYPVKRSMGFGLLLVSFILMMLTLIITLAVEVPIDNEIKQWTVDTLPNGWEPHLEALPRAADADIRCGPRRVRLERVAPFAALWLESGSGGSRWL